ncbi:flavin reductase family protein [Streptomyces sp. NPDC003758]|uniref:Flavin reductase family protein n=1 Tax=Streptomyces cynarae TaxID=2981134 RepID=A0ABY6DZJ8_9ACTN|nr:flavin reductase family protein [Streptomyces cynarae]UXY19849.1 flavin reductase family protein [Streptomyces cynarae]
MTVEALARPSLIGNQEFRDAMALLAAPVTVVTTVDAVGRRRGFTASAVSSVSMDPPLLSVGLARTSSCHDDLLAAPEFVVNVLAGHQQDVARGFARQGQDRFAQGTFAEWPGTGLPYLPDALMTLHCRLDQVVEAGDHVLVLGAICGTRTSAPGKALVWYDRAFHTPG